MKRPLDELAKLAAKYDCPILYGGDIFHHWKASPELINFAIDSLPRGFAVPGQHDLPHHRLEDIKKSAFWTLCEAKILDIIHEGVVFNNCVVRPFPWGKPLHKNYTPSLDQDGPIHVALVHRYCWLGKSSYPGAPPEQNAYAHRKKLKGYDFAIFGDNHKGFALKCKDMTILNCGGFMCRRSDERAYRPRIYVVYNDKTFKTHYLDTSLDKWSVSDEDTRKLEEMGVDTEGLMELLSRAGDAIVNFTEAIEDWLDQTKPDAAVVKIIRNAVEAARGKK